MYRIAVTGATGRMGRTVVNAISEAKDCQLAVATARANNPLLGQDIGDICAVGSLAVPLVPGLEAATNDFDILIDFTLPDYSLKNAIFCAEKKKAAVICTTGFGPQSLEKIKTLGEEIPLVFAPNTSTGINLVLELLKISAKAVGAMSDIEIIEAHHRHKKDAPSGTALKMGEVVAKALDRDLKQCAIYGRQGVSSEERDQNTIAFSTIRAGDIIGDHKVMFATKGERIEISHKATNRQTFAQGALRAARWLAQQRQGFYTMQDVLGFS